MPDRTQEQKDGQDESMKEGKRTAEGEREGEGEEEKERDQGRERKEEETKEEKRSTSATSEEGDTDRTQHATAVPDHITEDKAHSPIRPGEEAEEQRAAIRPGANDAQQEGVNIRSGDECALLSEPADQLAVNETENAKETLSAADSHDVLPGSISNGGLEADGTADLHGDSDDFTVDIGPSSFGTVLPAAPPAELIYSSNSPATTAPLASQQQPPQQPHLVSSHGHNVRSANCVSHSDTLWRSQAIAILPAPLCQQHHTRRGATALARVQVHGDVAAGGHGAEGLW